MKAKVSENCALIPRNCLKREIDTILPRMIRDNGKEPVACGV